MIRDRLPERLRRGAPGWRFRWWCAVDEFGPMTVDEVWLLTLREWRQWLSHPTLLTPAQLPPPESPYHEQAHTSRFWERSQAEARALDFAGWRERLAYEGDDPDAEED